MVFHSAISELLNFLFGERQNHFRERGCLPWDGSEATETGERGKAPFGWERRKEEKGAPVVGDWVSLRGGGREKEEGEINLLLL